jgi:hypothetical protein
MRFSNDINGYVVLDRLEILFARWTAPDETVAQVDDFRPFFLQSGRFGHDFIRFSAITSTTRVKSHEFHVIIGFKLSGFVAHGRKTIEPRTVGAMGITANNTNFRRHNVSLSSMTSSKTFPRSLLKYVDASQLARIDYGLMVSCARNSS